MSILKVNQIQHANGTEAMTIDSSGNVTIANSIYNPNVIAFDIGGSAGTVTVNAGQTLPFTTPRVNIGSHYNTSTYTFTAPVTGTYFFSFSVYTQGAVALCYHVNGAQLGGSNPIPLAIHNTSGRNVSASTIITLNANDTVKVASRDNGGSTVFMAHSNFNGYLIG